jgi:hypothetical protein
MLGNYRVAAQLVASRAVLTSVGFYIYIYVFIYLKVSPNFDLKFSLSQNKQLHFVVNPFLELGLHSNTQESR